MEDRKVNKLDYEDIEDSIEVDIFGLRFNMNNIDLDRMKNIDKKDNKVIEETLKCIIGEDCVERINEKRKKDGKGILTPELELKIMGFLMSTYAEYKYKTSKEAISEISTVLNKYGIKSDYNRQERRQYNRQNHYNNKGYYGRNKRY